jgi:hypothetical protein
MLSVLSYSQGQQLQKVVAGERRGYETGGRIYRGCWGCWGCRGGRRGVCSGRLRLTFVQRRLPLTPICFSEGMARGEEELGGSGVGGGGGGVGGGGGMGGGRGRLMRLIRASHASIRGCYSEGDLKKMGETEPIQYQL